jgi:hypothetical protein
MSLDKKPRIIYVLVLANLLYGMRGVYSLVRYLTSFHPERLEVHNVAVSFSIYAILGAIGAFIHLLVAYGLWKAKRWAVLSQKVLAIPYLLNFVVGTIYAISVFLFLSGQEVKKYFYNKN